MLTKEDKMRVCAYCRTGKNSDEAKLRSHYEQLAESQPNWLLKEVYVDVGVSGRSLENRDALHAMLEACKRGEYDIIVTKDPARLARNAQDFLALIQTLSAMQPPVRVILETDAQGAQKATEFLRSCFPA